MDDPSAHPTSDQPMWTCCICGRAADVDPVTVLAYVHEDGAAQQFAAHAACFGERLAPQAEFDYALLTE